MNYPNLTPLKETARTVSRFAGYNHNLRIGDGEFYDMKNLSSDRYPVLAPRGKRGIYARPASPQGLIARDGLCYVDGSSFVMGEKRVELGLSVAAESCPKQLISMGAYVIILPDKVYINTLDLTDRGAIDAVSVSEGTVTFSLCTESGESYDGMTVSKTAPENPENLSYWLDTSGKPLLLKQYSADSDSWVAVLSTYVRIGAAGIGTDFKAGDGIALSGITAADSLNGAAVISSCGADYVVIPGILEESLTQEGSVKLERAMPEVDFVIECGNRLWGCRYGKNREGQVVNEIYASKLGDFKNWNCFAGLSTDSYAVSLGSDGPFTGAVAYLGYPMFFKETVVHKIYGRYPAAFQLQDTTCRGVQSGCHGSLAIVGEILYYKSRDCVCAFDGSLPVEVSRPLGSVRYSRAVGGAVGSKYYLSMADEGGNFHLLVYDTARSLWHKEDDLQALAFCACNGELYCIDGGSRNILTLLGSGEQEEEQVQWMAQTGNLSIVDAGMKYLSRLNLRLWLGKDAKAEIYARYEEDSPWLHICTIFGTSLRSFTVPIRPRRADHFALRLVGTGDAKLYSIRRIVAEGSDEQ